MLAIVFPLLVLSGNSGESQKIGYREMALLGTRQSWLPFHAGVTIGVGVLVNEANQHFGDDTTCCTRRTPMIQGKEGGSLADSCDVVTNLRTYRTLFSAFCYIPSPELAEALMNWFKASTLPLRASTGVSCQLSFIGSRTTWSTRRRVPCTFPHSLVGIANVYVCLPVSEPPVAVARSPFDLSRLLPRRLEDRHL